MKGWVLAAGLAALVGCDGDEPPVVNDPDRNRVVCEPKTAGLENAERYEIPGVDLPEACKILEDDPSIAVHRRQVTEIESETELQTECRLQTPDAIAGLINFTEDRLLLVRIPDISAPRWAVKTGDTITVGESTTECTGAEVHGLRYLILAPRTATVSFFLCPPTGCDGEE